MSEKQKNVLGEDLEDCSKDPLTGWFRDGCCNTDKNDHGLHTVCVKVNDEFSRNNSYIFLQTCIYFDKTIFLALYRRIFKKF